MIYISRLKLEDAKALFEFETENKDFFESMVPKRPEAYYHYSSFREILEELLEEQLTGSSYFYLIRDDDNQLVGRINLIDIESRTGQLGYRIGKKFTGRGIATTAVGLLLKELDKVGASEVAAKTTSDNIPSQLVLERNGFTKMEEKKEVFMHGGSEVSFVYYRWDRK